MRSGLPSLCGGKGQFGGGGGERNKTLTESPDGDDEWVSPEAIAGAHLQLGAL